MKKIFLFISAVAMAMCLNAAEEIIQVDGIYYQVDVEKQTAVLLQDQSEAKLYDLEEIVVPVSVEKDGINCDVVALGKAAFRQSTAKSITFAEGSKVAELGMQTFQRAHNVKELVLPEGIKLMPLTGIHTDQKPEVEPYALEHLVLPASIDSLAMMSVVAPNLKVIEFLGTVPPRCCHKYIAATDYYQVPWEINASHVNFTSKECLVIVPAEALDAYKAAPGIGDYFTHIMAASEIVEDLEADGLYYKLNNKNLTATLLATQNEAKKYEQDDIVIPVSVEANGLDYPVVALDKAAFRNSTAKSITFAEGSKVVELGMQVFQAAVNLQELELPEGIKIIPMTGIHNATAANPMQMKKLILPASVDSIVRMSICLPQLEMLEFKGAIPPRINTFTTATNYTQNPWEINVNNVCNTAKTALVVVPDGALDAYKNTEWIGDYFNTIIEKKDVPSAIEEVKNPMLQSGIYTITGIYVGEDITILPKGLYIINGKKVVH